MRHIKAQPYLIIIVVLALLLSFLKVSKHDLQEWDEGRNGVTAWEMYHNHDFVNFYYCGQFDTWSAKPPLLIWLTVASYHLVGFNELGLRLPCILASIAFFIVFFRLVSRFADEQTAFISSLILIASRAIIADHMGITGDFDMPLVLWLTCATYCFLSFIEYDQKHSIIYSAFFIGLAFYTKGSAALIFPFSMFLFLTLRGRLKSFFLSKQVWLAITLLSAIIGSWITLVSIYGIKPEKSFYGSDNAITTMIVHDTWRRLFSTDFSNEYHKNYGFFFVSLDLRLNLWNYLFYIAVVASFYRFIKSGKKWKAVVTSTNPLLVFSWCIIIPYALLMTVASFKHNWYLAPAFGFIAYVTAQELSLQIKRYQQLRYPIAGLFMFTLIRQFLLLNDVRQTSMHQFFIKEKALAKNAQTLAIAIQPQQDILLYLLWLGKPVQYYNNTQEAVSAGASLILGSNKELPIGYVADMAAEDYVLMRKE